MRTVLRRPDFRLLFAGLVAVWATSAVWFWREFGFPSF